MKITKQIVFMNMSKEIAKLSPDSQTQVGSVLISPNGRQIASSYNGFVNGADDDSLPNTRPDKYQYIQHSEANLLYNCLDQGITTRNCTVFCTLSPCLPCLRAMFQSGIRKIYYNDLYFKDTSIYTIPDIKVNISSSSGGFTILNLKTIKESKIENS